MGGGRRGVLEQPNVERKTGNEADPEVGGLPLPFPEHADPAVRPRQFNPCVPVCSLGPQIRLLDDDRGDRGLWLRGLRRLRLIPRAIETMLHGFTAGAATVEDERGCRGLPPVTFATATWRVRVLWLHDWCSLSATRLSGTIPKRRA